MRLFISLDLPGPLVNDLSRLQDNLPPGRRVDPDNLHLTLAFLGEVPEPEIEAIHDALDSLHAAPIQLTLTEPAIFGGTWGQAVGLTGDGGDALTDLHARVLSRLRGAGAAPERRRFRPHVTLVRLRGGEDAGRMIAALAGRRFGPVACTSFSLMASHLRRESAEYEPLATYPLGAVPWT